MSNINDNSLLGFLQKKSLFSNSPNQNGRKRSRSKSRDSKNFDRKSYINSFEERSVEESIVSQVNQIPQYNYRTERKEVMPNPESKPLFQNLQQPERPTQSFTLYDQMGNNQRNMRMSPPSFKTQDKNLEMSQWSNASQSPNGFESARLESAQCLENLTVKVNSEISSINYKIDAFNTKMVKVLNNELRTIRQKILQVFEAAFKESDKYIQEYMKKKEAELAGDLIKMKGALEQERVKVLSMTEELRKPQWRKVAGEILSTEFESRVQQVINKSKQMQAGRWQLGDIAGYHIRNIQKEMKEIVRLKIE